MVPNIGLFILLSFLSLFSNAVSAAEGDAQQLQLIDGAKKKVRSFFTRLWKLSSRGLSPRRLRQNTHLLKPTFFALPMTKSSVV